MGEGPSLDLEALRSFVTVAQQAVWRVLRLCVIALSVP